MEDNKLKLNLQLFAEDTTEETPPTETKIEVEEVKTFTQDDVDTILSKRLARDRSKWEEEFKTTLAKEKQEAEELAKLSEKERHKAIIDRERKEFESERASFQREKVELEVIKQLATKSLPTEFASLLVDDTAEVSFENIATFEKQWQLALEKAVKERIAGKTPEIGGAKQVGTIQDFMTMANEASIRK